MGKIDRRRATRLEEDVKRAITFDHPNLALETCAKGLIITGTLSVAPTVEEFQANGAILSYEVRIEIPVNYPGQEPKVFELSGAFPHTADYHCNDSGDCCICVFETWRATAADTSFEAYLNGPIRNFFLSQFVKKETGNWPFGEWAHGKKGYLDSCADRLECKSSEREVKYLLRVLSQKWPKGHWQCPCNSGKNIRHCCSERLISLSEKVGSKEARAMLARLKQLG